MDQYTILLKELETYFDLESVELSEDEISALDLFNIVNEKFKELYDLHHSKEFIEQINSELTQSIVVGKFFKKIIPNFIDECDNVLIRSKNQTSRICFCFRNHKYEGICKDMDSEEIYFDTINQKTIINNDFILRHYDKIMSMFATIEEFSDLIQGNIDYDSDRHNHLLRPQIFSDSFLDVTLSYNIYGKVEIDIKINKSRDPEDIFKREWVKRKGLSEIVEENKEAILSNIPIDINQLNSTCEKIISQYREKNKVKSLDN